MFSASVALRAKTIRAGSGAPNSAASWDLVASTAVCAAIARAWPDRPGLPALCSRKSTMLSATAGGFGNEVAALSR